MVCNVKLFVPKMVFFWDVSLRNLARINRRLRVDYYTVIMEAESSSEMTFNASQTVEYPGRQSASYSTPWEPEISKNLRRRS